MKYRALRIISTIFKVLGWIVLVLGILGTCAFSGLVATGGGLGLLGEGDEAALTGVAAIAVAVGSFLGGIIMAGIYSLYFFAVSEGIQVVLAIEENTRAMVAALQSRG